MNKFKLKKQNDSKKYLSSTFKCVQHPESQNWDLTDLFRIIITSTEQRSV